MTKRGCMAMTMKQSLSHPSPNSGFLKNQDEKAHQVRSNVKVLLTVFFYYNSSVYYKLLPSSCTVNKQYYIEFLHRLYEATQKNYQTCGQTILGFFTMIMHWLTMITWDGLIPSTTWSPLLKFRCQYCNIQNNISHCSVDAAAHPLILVHWTLDLVHNFHVLT